MSVQATALFVCQRFRLLLLCELCMPRTQVCVTGDERVVEKFFFLSAPNHLCVAWCLEVSVGGEVQFNAT